VMRFREVVRRAVLALGAAVVMLVALEGLLRGFVIPSPRSAGRLFGSELPPVRLIPAEPPRPPRRDTQVKRVRYDDLNGIVRDDPVLGYAPREDTISTNGWWQSNNLGARDRHDTAPTVAPGTRRVLVFGDSSSVNDDPQAHEQDDAAERAEDGPEERRSSAVRTRVLAPP